MQKIWVLLEMFQILPTQLLEDFDIVVALESEETTEKGQKSVFLR